MSASPFRMPGPDHPFYRLSEDATLLLGRFSIAAIFWLSAQTKVDGFALNLLSGEWEMGWPQLSASVVELFREEYRLPILPPYWAAVMAAVAEHVFSALLLLGLATRLSAVILLIMTAVIQIFVYPDAYPTHGVWATVLLWLVLRGGGAFSLDRWWFR